MNKKIVKTIIISVLLLINFSAFPITAMKINEKSINDAYKNSSLTNENGNILYVGGGEPGNYSKIRDAVDNASNGDTIFVYNGIYCEITPMWISKTINLVGENKDKTIIDGRNKDSNIIIIYADGVNISGFTIQNSTGSWLDVTYAGILIIANNTTIKNNIFTNNFAGIYTRDWDVATSCDNTISENLFIDCFLYLYGGTINNMIYKNNFLSSNPTEGIIVSCSHNNQILENNFSGNFGTLASFISSSNNIIKNNNFSSKSSNEGISISDSNYNQILENNFSGNYSKVISITDSSKNNIKNNTIQGGKIYNIELQKCNKNNINYNNIENCRVGIYINRGRFNKINHNNFINCSINAIFVKSLLNLWNRNYWEKSRILPKIIFGTKGIIGFIPWINLDLFPAKKPYDI